MLKFFYLLSILTMKLVFWILSSIWILSILVFSLEPYYLKEINQNIQEIENNAIDKSIEKQDFIYWENTINEPIYLEVPLKEKLTKISIVNWKISYRLFYQNLSFKSFLSPEKYIFIDNLTSLSKEDTFDCIKIMNFEQNNNKKEICKYIVIWNKKYPELRLEIYPLKGTWATILFEAN